MATVTGLTAERMLGIEGASVVDGEIINQHLIFTRHDGTTIDAGVVTGSPGPQGPPGLDSVPAPIVIDAKTASYSLVLSDKNKMIEISNASPTTLTVPNNVTHAFAIGDTVYLMQTGAGLVTVAGAGGVTVVASPGLKLGGQYAVASLLKRGTNSWVLMGNLSA